MIASAAYVSEVSDTTEARANLRAALKESKRTDEKDYLRLVKVLPSLLFAVAAGLLVAGVGRLHSQVVWDHRRGELGRARPAVGAQ